MKPYSKSNLLQKQNSCQHFFVKMKNKPPWYQCVYCLKELRRDQIFKWSSASDVSIASTGGERLTDEEEEGCRAARGQKTHQEE